MAERTRGIWVRRSLGATVLLAAVAGSLMNSADQAVAQRGRDRATFAETRKDRIVRIEGEEGLEISGSTKVTCRFPIDGDRRSFDGDSEFNLATTAEAFGDDGEIKGKPAGDVTSLAEFFGLLGDARNYRDGGGAANFDLVAEDQITGRQRRIGNVKVGIGRGSCTVNANLNFSDILTGTEGVAAPGLEGADGPVEGAFTVDAGLNGKDGGGQGTFEGDLTGRARTTERGDFALTNANVRGTGDRLDDGGKK